MSIENNFSNLAINGVQHYQSYQFINVFKNPNKLPINEIHLERQSRELKKDRKNIDFLESSSKDITDSFFETRKEIIPALDKRWLPKVTLPKFEPFPTLGNEEEKVSSLAKNFAFIEGLDYLINCNFHQFWCTILFEPSAAISLQSFLNRFLMPYQTTRLEEEYFNGYQAVFTNVLIVYGKLLTFRLSETEHIPQTFAIQKLKERKLLSLPIVISLSILYSNTNMSFINQLTDLYFNDPNELEFLIKEVDCFIDQNQVILEMIGGQICGFDENATIVPISLEKRPLVFNLTWIYSAVHYLLSILVTLNAFFHIHKPAVEVAMEKDFPLRLPYMYVNVYRELYELLDNREEETTEERLFKLVIEEINVGRREFIELYHTFVSSCLDEALKHMGDTAKQESVVENYLRLLTTALEDEFFICDYDEAYSVANQNETFESCCDIDQTRTQFIVQCLKKLPRHKKMQELSKVKRQTLEMVFRDFAPAQVEPEAQEPEPQPGTSRVNEDEVDDKIKSIVDMFPHLGDGYIYQCLESYNFNPADVINAILENNLPPHLAEIPFDSIRIPPEPEPEKPILAYKGKKPDYDDALKLLNDKSGIKDIKNLMLEGVQFDYDYMYDDEYDDRDNDNVIAVPDNPVTEEISNPNRRPGRRQEESEEESEEETSSANQDKTGLNFCEDPAVVRERREARFRGGGPSKPKDVVGNPKGQGQEKSTLISRQKKNANKSSRANHSRKGGAQWKRNKGMIPS